MGQTFLLSGLLVSGMALAAGLALVGEPGGEALWPRAEPVRVEQRLEPVRELPSGGAGSALASAAFGLSALQPETYNGEIVLDIIEASPLDMGEKDQLAARLLAAEAGHGELPHVLADIRVSLAIE